MALQPHAVVSIMHYVTCSLLRLRLIPFIIDKVPSINGNLSIRGIDAESRVGMSDRA